MTRFRIFAGASLAAALTFSAGLAYAAPIPAAVDASGRPTQVSPAAHCIAPALQAQGYCTYEAADNPAPVAQSFTDIAVQPAVTASSYGTGVDVGGVMTLPGVVFSNAALMSGRIEEVTLYSKSAQTGEIDFVWCGSGNPTSSTVTDHNAVSIAAADFNKCRTVAQLTNWQSFGTVSVATSGQIATPFYLGTGTTGYGFLITRSTATAFASTSDLSFTLRVGH